MTTTTQENRRAAAGNGVTTAFPYNIKFLDEADLVVLEVDDTTGAETPKTLTTHYTVTGEGSDSGGTVTMLVAPATGKTLVIYQDPDLTQELDLSENDSLPAEEVEAAFDKLTILIQRLAARADRVIALSEAADSAFDTTLSDLTPGGLIRVNADGDGFDTGTPESFTFDESAPGTTKGDLIVHSGTTHIRKAVGANDTLLIADSAQTGGVKWGGLPTGSVARDTLAVGAVGKSAVSAITSATTLSATVDTYYMSASGGAFALTLPDATTMSGKRFTLTRTDNTLANQITFASIFSQKFITQGETMVIESNGTTWILISRSYPRSWVSYTQALSATTTPPTKHGSPTRDIARWRRVSDEAVELWWQLEQTTAGTAGTGSYLFTLPNSWVADATVHPPDTDGFGSHVPGRVDISDRSTGDYVGSHVLMYDSTHLAAYIAPSPVWASTATVNFGTANLRVGLNATVTISGWA